MNWVLVTRDLMVSAAAAGIEDRSAATCVIAASGDDALMLCAAHSPALLVVDLRCPDVDLPALVTQARAQSDSPPRILAFGPHVHEQSLAAAAAAGCDEVVTRGEFERRVEAALARLQS